MTAVLLVKAFQGIIETVEVHPTEESAWGSLREYVGAPSGSRLNDWWQAWVSPNPPDWYNHDHYGDCRILCDCGTTGEMRGVRVFRQNGLGRNR